MSYVFEVSHPEHEGVCEIVMPDALEWTQYSRIELVCNNLKLEDEVREHLRTGRTAGFHVMDWPKFKEQWPMDVWCAFSAADWSWSGYKKTKCTEGQVGEIRSSFSMGLGFD